MTFKEFLKESNINKKNWENLKLFMKKQPGYDSWTFEGNYEVLIVGFKTNKQAINAFKKSNASFNEISAYGSSSAGNSEIRVELNKDAKNALNESKLSTDDIINFIKKNAKTQGLYGNLFQTLDDAESKKTFLKLVAKNKINDLNKLDKFIVDNKYFRNNTL